MAPSDKVFQFLIASSAASCPYHLLMILFSESGRPSSPFSADE